MFCCLSNAKALRMCHPSTVNWVSFGDIQIKPSTRIKVGMSCPQLISVDPQGTFCHRTSFQILEKYSNCKIANYGAVALQMFTYLLNFMRFHRPWGCLRV